MLMALPENHREAFKKAIPMRKFAQPSDIAKAIMFFASDMSDYVTGQTLAGRPDHVLIHAFTETTRR